MARRANNKRSKFILVLLLLLVVLLLPVFDIHNNTTIFLYKSVDIQGNNSTNGGGGFDMMPVYELKDKGDELRHMEEINIANRLRLLPKAKTIDEAHRHGLIHSGAWIFITDSYGYALLLQRGPQLVTCPNAWGLLGEHTLYPQDQQPQDTVIRAVQEELGIQVHNIQNNSNINNILEANVIEPLTSHPVYYIRDYGPSNGGRIDRQLTYLFWIQFNQPYQNIPLELDDEVAQHKWMTLDQLQEWLDQDHDDKNNTSNTLKFCHSTLLPLLEVGLLKLKQKISTKA